MFANNSEFIFTEFYTSSLPCTIQMVPSVYHASTVVGPPRFFFWEGGDGHLFLWDKCQILGETGKPRQHWETGIMRKQIFDFC